MSALARTLVVITHTHHALDYVELNVTTLGETKALYEVAFGWLFNEYGPSYAGIRSPDDDREVGGLNATQAPVPGGPLVLLYSDDLDATAEAVTAAGGRVTDGPYDFPEGGACTSPIPAATNSVCGHSADRRHELDGHDSGEQRRPDTGRAPGR